MELQEILKEVKEKMLRSADIDDWNDRRAKIKETYKDRADLNKIMHSIDGQKLIKQLHFPNKRKSYEHREF